MATPSNIGGTAVIGYFRTGEEAHRAINALVEDGFRPEEIGAAFHTGQSETGASGTAAGASGKGEQVMEEEAALTPRLTTSDHTRTGTSSAASDTIAVQYASLGGGAGTPYDGPGRPAPIPGSDIEHSGLPSELKSTLPHDSDLQRGTEQTQVTGHTSGRGTWSERLDPVFEGKDRKGTKKDDDVEAQMDREARDFGTGEGHLNIFPARQRYSQPAFEKSFSGYGAQPEQARHLSHRIGGGGAIVTVHAAARTEAAERILRSNGGDVDFKENQTFEPNRGNSDVEVFGTVGRDYPGHLS